jgi:hypothetical protein
MTYHDPQYRMSAMSYQWITQGTSVPGAWIIDEWELGCLRQRHDFFEVLRVDGSLFNAVFAITTKLYQELQK